MALGIDLERLDELPGDGPAPGDALAFIKYQGAPYRLPFSRLPAPTPAPLTAAQIFPFLRQGDGIKLTLQGDNTILIACTVQSATTPTPPARPTGVQVDDTANTMSALLVPGYPTVLDYEFFGIPGFADPVPAATAGGDVQNGRIYARGITGEHGPGAVGIRVVASGARPAGGTAVNDRPFTGPTAPIENQKPSVSFAPYDSTAPTVGVAKQYSALATDQDGTVTLVELVRVTSASSTTVAEVLDSDVSSPYLLTWVPSAAGTYYLAARATDNQGATSLSSVLAVAVQAGGTGPPVGGGDYITTDYITSDYIN